MPNTEPQALTLTLCRFAGGGRRQSVPSLAPLYREAGEGGVRVRSADSTPGQNFFTIYFC